MSGGVDSSVSALLLLQQGYRVEGLFMKNWNEDDGSEYCTAQEDMFDALQVCEKLGIELHTANFASQYWDQVFAHFLEEYRAGRTPNPDILCNREIKFKVFLDYCDELGADYIATGHYVRNRLIESDDNGDSSSPPRCELLRGLDNNKDQSYFLHTVDRSALAKTLFPVGEITKPEVRQLAREHDLVTHSKKDSTGICFIGERRFSDFLETYLPAQPGNIETPEGTVLGTHKGLMFHTLGQREGLGIGGVKGADERPWYVAGKNLESNTLIVVQGNEHPLLYCSALRAEQLHWINEVPSSLSGQPQSQPQTLTQPQPPAELEGEFHCTAKTRYRQPDQACTVSLEGDSCTVYFETPQRAVTPGQSVVFYDGDVCLGGGIISAQLPSEKLDSTKPDAEKPHSAKLDSPGPDSSRLDNV